MKTSSKIIVSLGLLSTIGALAGVMVYRRNKPKDAKALLDQGIDLAQDVATSVDASLDRVAKKMTSPHHTIKTQPKEVNA